MQSHTTNKDLSKKLADAGANVESEFYWWKGAEEDTFKVGYKDHVALPVAERTYPAYLLSELLDMLPDNVKLFRSVDEKGAWCMWHPTLNFKDKNPANAAAKLLLWLIEQGHIDPNNLES